MAISTGNVDAGSDSPRLARAQIKETIDVVNALETSAGSAGVGFIQSGTGAVATTVQEALRRNISIFDFIPQAQHAAIRDLTSTYDCTTAIATAIAVISQLDYGERHLEWEGGLYRTGKVDLTDTKYINFHAKGTVQIIGNDDTQVFVFGSSNYNSGNPAASTKSDRIVITGGPWLIAPLAGETYTYGLCLEHFVSCELHNFSVSGNFGSATAAHRVSTRLQYSYINKFINCSFSSPGVPDTGYYSYSVCHGEPGGSNDNVNLNEYDNCRFVGVIGNTSAADTFCVKPAGYANSMLNCDVSGAYYGIDLTNSSGGKFNVYLEGCQRLVTTGKGPGFAGGNTFTGGFYEVLQDGIAFELGLGGGSQNTVIIGPKVRGYSGATNRTLIDHGVGGATYGISVIHPDCENIDNYHAGTYRGEGGFGGAFGKVLQTAWLSFPVTQVPSSDANTLDDYEEGSWTPTASGITGTNTYAGTYTKIGERFDWEIQITTSDTIGMTGGTSTLTLPFTTGAKNCCMSANQTTGIGYGTGLITGNLAYPPTAAPAAGQSITVSGSCRV